MHFPAAAVLLSVMDDIGDSGSSSLSESAFTASEESEDEDIVAPTKKSMTKAELVDELAKALKFYGNSSKKSADTPKRKLKHSTTRSSLFQKKVSSSSRSSKTKSSSEGASSSSSVKKSRNSATPKHSSYGRSKQTVTVTEPTIRSESPVSSDIEPPPVSTFESDEREVNCNDNETDGQLPLDSNFKEEVNTTFDQISKILNVVVKRVKHVETQVKQQQISPSTSRETTPKTRIPLIVRVSCLRIKCAWH